MRDGVAPRTRQEREPRGAWLGARRIGRELRLSVSHARRSALFLRSVGSLSAIMCYFANPDL